MIRLLEIIVALIVVCVLGVLVGIMLPDHGSIERKVEVTHPVRQVYDVLNGYRTYPAWTALTSYDPLVKLLPEGKDFGVGAKVNWSSENPAVGKGSLEITDSIPDKQIIMALTNTWKGENKKYTVKLEPDAKSKGKVLKIVWSYDVDYGWDLIARYSGLYLHGEPDTQIQIHLNKLANMIATFPPVDYSSGAILGLAEPPAIDIVDVTSKPVLIVSTKAKSNIDDFAEATTKAMESIQAVIKKDKLTQTGSPRTVTSVWGEENYEFDVVVPVDRNDISPPEGVKVGTTYAGKALTLSIEKVTLNQLKEAQKMLKAYAYTHGYSFDESAEGDGRFFDELVVAEANTAPPSTNAAPTNNETPAPTTLPKYNVYLPIQI